MRRLSPAIFGHRAFIAAAAVIVILPAAAAAQAQPRTTAPAADTTGAYADAATARLVALARAARQQTDGSMRSYTAHVSSRFAAGMRMPLKDRTLFRQETAARVRWSRDAANVVQMRAARVQHPGGVEVPSGLSGIGIDEIYDPSQDRLYFGMDFGNEDARQGDNDDFWIEHPLGEDGPAHYRFRTGDTITLRLHDGSTLRLIELVVMPRRSDPHTVRGTLWVEQASGSLVQAAFRLARSFDIIADGMLDADDQEDISKIPGFLKPMEFDISLMTVEYSLWEMRHWLPRMMRLEGVARVGMLQFPASAEVAYRMEDVLLDDDAPAQSEEQIVERIASEWAKDSHRIIRHVNDSVTYTVLMPHDSTALLRSEELPPPIWKEAQGFVTERELQGLIDRVSSIPGAVHPRVPARWGWGLGEPEMVRYNRVEALSVGARATLPLAPFTLTATGRLGLADLHPNAELGAVREGGRVMTGLRVYHELATTDMSRRPFGLGNSVSALLFGRDEGEYYRATGAALTITPPTLARRSWELHAYAERQDDVQRETQVALPRLWDRHVFRPNIAADEADQYGAMLRIRPWWGTDPRGFQFGIDAHVLAETGDYGLSRGAATLRFAAPIVAGVRFGMEAGAGSSAGDVTVQRQFHLGGASTLRGYEPGTVRGNAMARGRLELARTNSFGAVTVFSDWGWAGSRSALQEGELRRADQRLAFGAGYSFLDGLFRVDLARGVWRPTGWRLDLHVDAVL